MSQFLSSTVNYIGFLDCDIIYTYTYIYTLLNIPVFYEAYHFHDYGCVGGRFLIMHVVRGFIASVIRNLIILKTWQTDLIPSVTSSQTWTN
jgi:hypothetical protein